MICKYCARCGTRPKNNRGATRRRKTLKPSKLSCQHNTYQQKNIHVITSLIDQDVAQDLIKKKKCWQEMVIKYIQDKGKKDDKVTTRAIKN